MNKLLLNFFLLGLSLGLGPCIASCGPLLISYLAGSEKNIKKCITAYFLFSFSRILVYVILGLLVFAFGQLSSQYLFEPWRKLIIILGATFIIIIGLLMILGKNLDNRFCSALNNFFLKKDAKTIFIFGLIIGILPCLPFISVLSYIGLVCKTWLSSLIYSLGFGLGTIVSPLLIIATFTGLLPNILLPKNKLSKVFSFLCGLIIIFLGLQLWSRVF